MNKKKYEGFFKVLELGRAGDSSALLNGFEELLALYKKQERRLDKILKISDKQQSQLLKSYEELDLLRKKNVELAHAAGMEQISSEILHTFGNTLLGISGEMYMLKDCLDSLPDEKIEKKVRAKISSLSAEEVCKFTISLFKSINIFKEKITQSYNKLIQKLSLLQKLVDSYEEYISYKDFGESLNLNKDFEEMAASALSESHVFDKETERILITVQENLPEVFLDKSKLKKSLKCLLLNAVEARLADKEFYIAIAVKSDGTDIHIDVSDNGRGVNELHEKEIFQLGFTTKEGHAGAGLHSAANLLASMKCKILKINSTEFKSSFRILIPFRPVEERL